MAVPEDDGPPGVPEWVVTYGDMMSLLLTFFIMLVSLSELKTENGKIRAALDAIRERFGPTEGRISSPGESTQTTSVYDTPASEGASSEGGIEKAGRQSVGAAGQHTGVESLHDASQMTKGGAIQFERLQARLSEQAKQSLNKVSEELRGGAELILVRGHASPELYSRGDLQKLREIETFPVRDKTDLSFARAVCVAEYLIGRGIKSSRIRISAAGATEPRVVSVNLARQEENRRVDVFIIEQYIAPQITENP